MSQRQAATKYNFFLHFFLNSVFVVAIRVVVATTNVLKELAAPPVQDARQVGRYTSIVICEGKVLGLKSKRTWPCSSIDVGGTFLIYLDSLNL